MCSEMKEYEHHVWSLWFQIMKSYWTVIQPRLARRTWKRFIWPIQLTGTFSSAQYAKCKPTIFRACIGILRLNIPLLVNIIVLIVVKSLPIVFTWGNTYLIVVILMNFLVNKWNAKRVLILYAGVVSMNYSRRWNQKRKKLVFFFFEYSNLKISSNYLVDRNVF